MNSIDEISLSSLCDRIMTFCNRLNKRLDMIDEQQGFFTYTDPYAPLHNPTPAYITPWQTMDGPYFHNQQPPPPSPNTHQPLPTPPSYVSPRQTMADPTAQVPYFHNQPQPNFHNHNHPPVVAVVLPPPAESSPPCSPTTTVFGPLPDSALYTYGSSCNSHQGFHPWQPKHGLSPPPPPTDRPPSYQHSTPTYTTSAYSPAATIQGRSCNEQHTAVLLPLLCPTSSSTKPPMAASTAVPTPPLQHPSSSLSPTSHSRTEALLPAAAAVPPLNMSPLASPCRPDISG